MIRQVLKVISFPLSKITAHQTTASTHPSTLQSRAKDLPLPIAPSPFITQKSTTRLNRLQKQQLGLFIPESPFNHRLTKYHQKQYLEALTKELYYSQSANLSPFIRILQNNYKGFSQHTTLSQYINLIYKDIYARFLIAKGLGVQWQGCFANLGVLNKWSQTQNLRQQHEKTVVSALLSLISCSRAGVQRSKSIGLYSYAQRQFVDGNKVQIKTGKKMGYYVKMLLSHYGKYSQEFDILKQKDAFMSMLVVVEDLAKLINPNALCISKDSYYVILKKHDIGTQKTEYLIVASTIYQQHHKYFKEQKYEKHQTLTGKYLLQLKCNDIPIIAEIDGYQRPPNSYLVNSQIDLGDYQRTKHYELDHRQSFVSQNGQILYDGKSTGLALNSSKSQGQLLKLLSAAYCFVDMYEIVDREIYFEGGSKQVLSFRLGDKFSIKIGSEQHASILESLKSKSTVVKESKIQIPAMVKAKLPRQKRRFRKERKELLKQITDHPTLLQSVTSITHIPVSSFTPSALRLPLVLKDSQVTAYEEVLTEGQLQDLTSGKLVEGQFLKGSEYEVCWVYISESLMKSLLFLRKADGDKRVHNVIIEPQSQTQQLIPLSIHLHYMLQRRHRVQGRRNQKKQTFEDYFSLIKLHPTLSQRQGQGLVYELLEGVTKSNNVEQYGLGLQALRLWAARRDNYLGDRKISDEQINSQLKFSASIRKVFWDCASLLPAGRHEVHPVLYINKFMLDMIDCYISNIQESYKNIDIHQAYVLTIDFFQNIVDEIYIKTIKNKIIAYPNSQENQEHFYVIRKIVQLLPLISPLMPFSSFHISKHSTYHWPPISNPKFYQSIPKHNSMIKLRVELQNKMRLNRLSHFIAYLPSLKAQFTERDLQLFLQVDKVTTREPRQEERVASLLLNKSNCVSSQQRLILYKNQEHCVRCDPKSQNNTHLCKNCVDYLQQQVSQPLKFWPQKHLSHRPSPSSPTIDQNTSQ